MSKTIHDVIEMAGGAPAISRRCNITGAAVRRWRNEGDAIPVRYWKTIIAMADERGETLTVEDLMDAKMEKRDVAA